MTRFREVWGGFLSSRFGECAGGVSGGVDGGVGGLVEGGRAVEEGAFLRALGDVALGEPAFKLTAGDKLGGVFRSEFAGDAVEEFLGVGADLGAGAGAEEALDLLPVAAVEFEA